MKKKLVALFTCLVMIISILIVYPSSDASTTTLNITNNEQTIEVGKTLALKLNGINSSKVKWKSSNKKVATVSKTGTIKGIKKGNATITGKYKGVTYKISIKVIKKLERITLFDNEKVSLYYTNNNGIIKFYARNNSKKVITFSMYYVALDGEEENDLITSAEVIGPGDTVNIQDYAQEKHFFKEISGSFSIYSGNGSDSKDYSFKK